MLDIPQHTRLDQLTPSEPDERPAVVSAGATLCYAEFEAAVNHIAEVLRAKGVERDECVGVIVPRSPELLVAIHGILRAGAAYVPIDPGGPMIRSRTIIEDSGARIIVAGAEFAEIATELGVDRIEPTMARADPVEPVASPEDLAYVIYTSGSTGRPKGVEVEHRSVANRLQWMQRRYPLGADDVILQKTPVTFDVSVWELMWWAMAGASVALLEPGGERDPRKIIAAVERHRVTVMHFVPSMLGPFLDRIGGPTRLDAPAHVIAHGVLQRGSAHTGVGRAVQPGIRRHRRAAAGESLRADRGDGGRQLLRLPIVRARGCGPDRKADRQHDAAGSRRTRKPLSRRGCPGN